MLHDLKKLIIASPQEAQETTFSAKATSTSPIGEHTNSLHLQPPPLFIFII